MHNSGIDRSLDKSTKVQFSMACSTELRTAPNRGAASQSPGQQPGQQQGKHLHSPSPAYSTKLFKSQHLASFVSTAHSDHCTVWLRSRSYGNTHGVKASSPNPHSKTDFGVQRHSRGSAPSVAEILPPWCNQPFYIHVPYVCEIPFSSASHSPEFLCMHHA